DTDGLDYVFECEKKGDALICFGNMLNVMSPSQIARYTTLEVMKLIMKLRDDPELPSRVTRRASDAYDAFVGDKVKRNERMADAGYRRLWNKGAYGALTPYPVELWKVGQVPTCLMPRPKGRHPRYSSSRSHAPPATTTTTAAALFPDILDKDFFAFGIPVMFNIFNLGWPVARDKQAEAGGSQHLGVRRREGGTPDPSIAYSLTSILGPKRSRKRRRYSRRSDVVSIASSASGGSSGGGAFVASQFAEALSSSSSSDAESVQYQPSLMDTTSSSPRNIFQRISSTFHIRRHCTKLKKAETWLKQTDALCKIVRALSHQNAVKLFTELLQGDSQLQSKSLEVALLHWDVVTSRYDWNRQLTVHVNFLPFALTLMHAVGETNMEHHLVAFFKSHSNDIGILHNTALRVYSLFDLFPNRSTTFWCHMFAYAVSNMCTHATSIFGLCRNRSLNALAKFHGLMRTATADILQSTTHDISRALEEITKNSYPDLVAATLATEVERGVFYRACIALFDLTRTLGERDLWHELTSPLRWMVKPGIGSALIQIATGVPPWRYGGDDFPPLGRCLALAALRAMHKFEIVKQEATTGDQADEWFACLFEIMLGKHKWNISEKDLDDLVGSKKLYPHEDAYDILSCFPRSMFVIHLITVMEDACRAGKEECFQLLEPLAWLTRMENEELNDAMLSAGVFAFLEQTARLRLPENVGGLAYVVECEKKGDALICFRNMLDVMSPAQIARYTTVDMMKQILKLQDDLELPSRVTRRASDAYNAFVGDTKEKRTDRRADEDYRRLWVRVRPSSPVVAPASQPTEAPELDTFATVPAVFEGVPPPDGHDDEPSAALN
ncbi:hypothetical protein FRB99_002685, partial [Tulasnella sp. 403]